MLIKIKKEEAKIRAGQVMRSNSEYQLPMPATDGLDFITFLLLLLVSQSKGRRRKKRGKEE